MIQDIEPHIFKNQFTPRTPDNEDYVFVFQDNKVLLISMNEEYKIPTFAQMKQYFPGSIDNLIYLFSVDAAGMFLFLSDRTFELSQEGFTFEEVRVFRTFEPKWLAFAGITARHLNHWYQSNRFCGCCGKPMHPCEGERAMKCDECGFVTYPKICPAIIVGVINDGKIMLTRYANRSFTRYALIAGFCEIGETLEDTVRREVMEEVGVKVKNIRYYKNQPWGFSESLLVGFFAELDGDEKVTLDTQELSEGAWFAKEDIPEDTENSLSLTYTMMKAFRDGEIEM